MSNVEMVSSLLRFDIRYSKSLPENSPTGAFMGLLCAILHRQFPTHFHIVKNSLFSFFDAEFFALEIDVVDN
jgi:hypothetical protein